MAAHVKKGDTVLVISGKDKGVTGKVIASYPDKQRVLVEGVNRIKKHTKIGQSTRGAKTGGIVTQEAADPRHQRDARGRGRRQEGRPGSAYRATTTVERDGRTKTVRVRVAKRSGKDI